MTAAAPDPNRLRERDLLYFGRVLAGQCHELANALNVAVELCGLHEDTLPRAREGHPGAVDKLGDIVRRVQAQLARSHTIVRALSRFAHSVDEPWIACGAREILERAVFLAGREARLRKVELEAVVPASDLRLVECSPFRLQQAIHEGIGRLLEDITEGGRITASLTTEPGGAVIVLESSGSPPGNAGGGRLEFFIPRGPGGAGPPAEVSNVD